ncbi:MAG: efflux RND transporter permease subunit [Epsilonproteobacteria bacterium]|nr:AcrB/AcrD/AcrF family protein [Campylobacterota bacterium]NPA56140.1 efflux RND transporter permease subunit [Campylobacterota bacterium]
MEEVKCSYKPKDIAGKLALIFLHNPLTPLLAIFILAVGYLALEIMPREEDPQIAISGGSVIVPMPGATPKEIENVIVKPLEEKIREISGVEYIYGMAMRNVGIVNVQYYIGQNREISNLKLYDKVMQNMNLLPKHAMQPLVKPFDIDIDIPILTYAFYKRNPNLSDARFYKIVKEIQYKVNRVKDVSKTQLKGAHRRQFNILVDLNKLTGYHLSMGQIMKAVQSVALEVPDIKNKTKDNRLVIFGVPNAIESIEDVENIMVANYMGSPIYVKDIATVEDGIDIQNFKEAKIWAKGAEGDIPQYTLEISKLKGTNAVFVANDVQALMEEIAPQLQKEGIGFVLTRDYGKRANDAVNELVDHLLITIAIIAIMLVFFLGWKEALIVTFTVPAILAITLFIAYITGQTINRITLFAFLLSLGLLVDAAIIVIENIHRHLHDHDALYKDMDTILVEATDEIGAPTNVATIAIILTMVPMAFVGGMMGEFMKPIPYNVPVALIASLLIAYIFTPYLSKKMLKKPKMHHHHHHFQKHEKLPEGCEIDGGKS